MKATLCGDIMTLTRNSRIAIYALSFWALSWIPYYLIFVLGNPPIEYFSLYEIGKSNLWLNMAILFLAISGEIALLIAVIYSIIAIFKNPNGYEFNVFIFVLIAVFVNWIHYLEMSNIVT
jgi:hypothetical protein